jgi:hypothetical protein
MAICLELPVSSQANQASIRLQGNFNQAEMNLKLLFKH